VSGDHSQVCCPVLVSLQTPEQQATPVLQNAPLGLQQRPDVQETDQGPASPTGVKMLSGQQVVMAPQAPPYHWQPRVVLPLH
jgi:hypothetical protein